MMSLAAAAPAAAPAPEAAHVPRRTSEADRFELVTVERSMLGGRVGIHVRATAADHLAAARDAASVLDRIEAWAARLTRFVDSSELSRLNGAGGPVVAVGPTLAAVLDCGRTAEVATDGLVDIALLDERLQAERGAAPELVEWPAASRCWSLRRGSRRSDVHRPAGLRFDVDGVAKGWLADRALARLRRYPAVAVDADGDVAIALDDGESLDLGIADPVDPTMDIGVLHLSSDRPGRRTIGVATSGTSVHRWVEGGLPRHHLIDPRTGRSAATDVVQATVVGDSARAAEAFAKVAVILGSVDGLRALERTSVRAAILVTDDGRMVSLPGTERFLA